MSEYRRIAMEARKNVSRLTLQQQKQLLGLYEDSIESLANKAARAKDKSLSQRWLLDYNKSLRVAKRDLAKKIQSSTTGAIIKGAKIGTEAEQMILSSMFKRAGIEPGNHFTSMFSQVQKGVVDDIISGRLYKDKKTLSSRIWDTSNKFEKDLQYIVNKGMLEKKSALELARDLEKFVKEPAKRPWNWGKVYPNLSGTRVDYNAQRLARTTINHSYQTASIKSSSMNPFNEGIEWRSALIHGRTCELCIERHGQIFAVDDVPLDHPNGLCTMLPHIPKSLDEVAEELRQWLDGADNPALDEWYDLYGDHFAGFKPFTGGIINVRRTGNKKQRYQSTKEVFKKISYRSIDPEYAAEIDSSFLDLQNTYPINEGNIEIKALAEKKAFGYSRGQIVQKGDRVVYVDEIVISNKHMKNARVSDRLHELNYSHRGSKLRTGIATVDHEYAHAIDNYYLMRTDDYVAKTVDKYRQGVVFRRTREHVNEINRFNRYVTHSKKNMSHEVYDRVRLELNLNPKEMDQLVKKELGTYAASSKAEFLAEGFANMRHLSEDTKTDFIRLFESVFNEVFEGVIK